LSVDSLPGFWALAQANALRLLPIGKVYLFILVGVALYWVLPTPLPPRHRQTLREWLLVAGGLVFAYTVVDTVGAFFIGLLTLVVYIFAGTSVSRSRPVTILLTVGLVTCFWWIITGRAHIWLVGLATPELARAAPFLPAAYLEQLRQENLLRYVVVRLFALRPPSAIMHQGLLTYLAYLMPVRMVHVVWDAHLGRTRVRGLRSMLAYTYFIPCLQCAPFMFYESFATQAEKVARPGLREIWYALFRIAVSIARLFVGLFVIVLYNNRVFLTPLGFSPGEAWLSAVAFTINTYLQLAYYGDFGRGFGILLGYQVPESVDRPLWAPNLVQWWRRWNMVITEWFKLYIYFPLGGNRKGEVRAYLNNLAVMVVCGLWHGISLPLFTWGALHGMVLCLTRFWQRRVNPKYPPFLQRPMQALSIAGTFTYFCFSMALLHVGMSRQPIQTTMEMTMRLLGMG